MDFYTQLNPILAVQNKCKINKYSITLYIFSFYLKNCIIILKSYNFFVRIPMSCPLIN